MLLTQLRVESLVHVNDNLMAVEQRCIVNSVTCFVSQIECCVQWLGHSTWNLATAHYCNHSTCKLPSP